MSSTKHALSVASRKIPRFWVRKVDPEDQKIRAQQRSIKRTQVENDLVGTVLFLASLESDFMTGQLLNVGGGFHFVG